MEATQLNRFPLFFFASPSDCSFEEALAMMML
jgi:hypothetical protein